MAVAATGVCGDGSVEDYTCCVFCRDPDFSTKLLLCFHSVCDVCLIDPSISKDGSITCGKCKAVTNVTDSDGKHNSLRTNDFQQVWTSLVQLFEAKPCIICSSQDKIVMGTHVCLDCGEDYLCKGCLPVHANVWGTKHHKPVPLANLKDAQWSEKIRKKVRARHYESCGEHDAVKKFYCLLCQTLLCQDCLHLDHSDHKCVMVVNVCNEERLNVEQLNKDLDKRFQYAQWQKAEFENLVERSRMDETAGVNEIAERVEAVKKMLDEWGKKKTEELREFYETTRQHYETNVAHCKVKSASLQSMATYSKLYLQYSSDKDFFKSVDALKEDVTEVLKNTTSKNGSPLVHKTLQYQWKSLRKMKKLLGYALIGGVDQEERLAMKTMKVIKCPTPEMISGLALINEQDIMALAVSKVLRYGTSGSHKETLKFRDAIEAWDIVFHGGDIYVGDMKKRQVKRIDRDGRAIHSICLQGVEARRDDDWMGLAVDHQRELMYICSTRKNIVYRCALNDAVAEPFVTSSTRLPLCSPHYLHVTHTGDIVVPNAWGHNVHVYNAKGQLKRVLGQGLGKGQGQFNGPSGVASDSYGYIYIADYMNHRVHILGADYTFLGSFPTDRGQEIRQPRAVLVTGEGDVWVSHSKNQITVFRPIRSIDSG